MFDMFGNPINRPGDPAIRPPVPTPTPTPVPMTPPEIKPEAVITSTTAGIQFGTWMPSLKSEGTIDVAIKNALYVKAEQLVTCTFDIVVTGMSGGKNNSIVTLEGLPHIGIPSSTEGAAGSLVVSYFKTTNQDVRYITGTVKGNSTSVEIWTQKRTSNGLSPFVLMDVNINTVLTGFVTYIAAA